MVQINDLFPGISDLKRYAPGISNQDELNEVQASLPFVKKNILDFIPGFWDNILAKTDSPELHILRSAVANLIMYKNITFLVVNGRVSNEKDVYKYEYEQMRREYLDNYYNAMDSLLELLSSSDEYRALWQKTWFAEIQKEVRIKSCFDFQKYYHIDDSYLFFVRTLPIQREVMQRFSVLLLKIEVCRRC